MDNTFIKVFEIARLADGNLMIIQPHPKKKEWIDVLKGIGIVAVVLGHAIPWADGGIVPLIFLFHMPLFFFISGYLFSPNLNVKDYAKKKAIHLLIPYSSFLVVILFLPELYRGFSSETLGLPLLVSLGKRTLLGGRRLEGAAGVFWFVTCLFFTQQIFNLVVTRLRSGWVDLIVVIAATLSYLNSLFFPWFWLPLNFNVVFAALPIFYAGYTFKKRENMRWLNVIASVIAIFALASVLAGEYNFYDMKVSNYGIPVITFASAIGTVIMLISLAKKLQQSTILSLGLVYLGQASMMIMFLHQAVMRNVAIIGVNSLWGRIVLGVCIPYLAFLVTKRFALCRALLLGSESDLRDILDKRTPGEKKDTLVN